MVICFIYVHMYNDQLAILLIYNEPLCTKCFVDGVFLGLLHGLTPVQEGTCSQAYATYIYMVCSSIYIFQFLFIAMYN